MSGEWELPAFGDEGEDFDTAVVSAKSLRPTSEGEQRAFLVFLSGDWTGRAVPVEGEHTLGRGTNASLRLTNDGISRQHARIFQRMGLTLIEDLGSTNGTFVNGNRVEGTVPLKDGDKIQLGGKFLLKFSLQDELDLRFQQELYEAALRDALTKAHNRRALLEHLDVELSHALRHGHDLSFMLFDIDRFKQTNDTHGHLAW